MSFKIEIADAAHRDIVDTVSYLSQHSRQRAADWISGLTTAIGSLQDLPYRHSLIPEATELGRPLRGFPHGSYRIIYEVDEERQMVFVVRIYHSARKPLTRSKIE